MSRKHPIIALDNHRRHSHYADFHLAKQRFELDVYYTALRNQDNRANLIHEHQRVKSLLENKLFRAGTEVFLAERRKRLAAQIGETFPR